MTARGALFTSQTNPRFPNTAGEKEKINGDSKTPTSCLKGTLKLCELVHGAHVLIKEAWHVCGPGLCAQASVASIRGAQGDVYQTAPGEVHRGGQNL